jgi:hypothetical protein
LAKPRYYVRGQAGQKLPTNRSDPSGALVYVGRVVRRVVQSILVRSTHFLLVRGLSLIATTTCMECSIECVEQTLTASSSISRLSLSPSRRRYLRPTISHLYKSRALAFYVNPHLPGSARLNGPLTLLFYSPAARSTSLSSTQTTLPPPPLSLSLALPLSVFPNNVQQRRPSAFLSQTGSSGCRPLLRPRLTSTAELLPRSIWRTPSTVLSAGRSAAGLLWQRTTGGWLLRGWTATSDELWTTDAAACRARLLS